MDELDEFLYGEAASATPSNSAPATDHALGATEDEDDVPYEPPEDDEVYLSPSATPNLERKAEDLTNLPIDDEEEEEEDDSDDDIEIVLDTVPPPATTTSTSSAPPIQKPAVIENVDKAGSTVSKPSPITRTQAKTAQPLPRQDGTVGPPVPPPTVQKAVVDVDEIGEFNGQEMLELDLDALEDKPWRKPGADITDYFNYGFNEETWKAYCAKQKRMREDYAPQAGMAKGEQAIEYPAEGQSYISPHHLNAARTLGQDIRAGKRPREDDDIIEIAPHDDGSGRYSVGGMREPRYHEEGYGGPDFGGPPPMGMFGPDPYGHMPPPFMPDMPPGPGYDNFRSRAPMPGRPGIRPVMPRNMRGDRPFFPMDMEPPLHPSYRPPPFARTPYDQRSAVYRESRRGPSPHRDDNPNA